MVVVSTSSRAHFKWLSRGRLAEAASSGLAGSSAAGSHMLMMVQLRLRQSQRAHLFISLLCSSILSSTLCFGKRATEAPRWKVWLPRCVSITARAGVAWYHWAHCHQFSCFSTAEPNVDGQGFVCSRCAQSSEVTVLAEGEKTKEGKKLKNMKKADKAVWGTFQSWLNCSRPSL